MNNKLKSILGSKLINQWNLFWLVTLFLCLANIIAMTRVDLTVVDGVSSMIQFSVRCAVPWLYLAFAASSIQGLFPGVLSQWLRRNRAFIGLCFAVAMAWQLLFILWMVGGYSAYYIEDVYVLSDAIEGVSGYIFLTAMTLTSFKFGRRQLSARQWKNLHKCGIYFIWAYAWSVYWFELFYYENPEFIDYVYYWAGLLAWGLRITAWSKKRLAQRVVTSPTKSLPLIFPVGVVAIAIGITGTIYGSSWSEQVYALFSGNTMMDTITSYVPYFPFVPFFPIFLMTAGVYLLVKPRGETAVPG